jgi:hypothetical protein
MFQQGEAQMTTSWKCFALAVALAVSMLGAGREAAATPLAHLVLHSEPGDFIGGGGDFDITYTPANSQLFFANVTQTVGTPPEPAQLDFVLGTVTCCSDNTFAVVTFGTDALGIPIAPGHYTDAERAAFASPGHPGLDISFQNRGCNTLTGSFDIATVAFSDAAAAATGSPIDRFSASFVQHCEGSAPALMGTFSYDAFPLTVPEPGTWLLLASVLPWLARRRAGVKITFYPVTTS